MDIEAYDEKYENDAWKKYDDLRKSYTKKFELRDDLSVSAKAYERHVVIEVGSTYRRTNVGTAREYAQMIIDACDYVDEQNPGWASNHVNLDEHLKGFERV